MEDKEKVKNNYNKIIENLERRLDKVKNDKKLYHKLKNILAIVSIIILSFGLWPVAIVGFLSMVICYLNEDKKSKDYNNLIQKLEDSYFSLQTIEEKEQEEQVQEVKEESASQEKEDYPILQVLYGENDDNKVYRKR
jgi:hypothetical protein